MRVHWRTYAYVPSEHRSPAENVPWSYGHHRWGIWPNPQLCGALGSLAINYSQVSDASHIYPAFCWLSNCVAV